MTLLHSKCNIGCVEESKTSCNGPAICTSFGHDLFTGDTLKMVNTGFRVVEYQEVP